MQQKTDKLLKLFPENKWKNFNQWHIEYIKIMWNEDMLKKIENYNDKVSHRAAHLFNKAWWNNLNLLRRYKTSDANTNIIEDIVWTMNGDMNIAAISMDIHNRESIEKIL